jgi:hypothetical protein
MTSREVPNLIQPTNWYRAIKLHGIALAAILAENGTLNVTKTGQYVGVATKRENNVIGSSG